MHNRPTEQTLEISGQFSFYMFALEVYKLVLYKVKTQFKSKSYDL